MGEGPRLLGGLSLKDYSSPDFGGGEERERSSHLAVYSMPEPSWDWGVQFECLYTPQNPPYSTRPLSVHFGGCGVCRSSLSNMALGQEAFCAHASDEEASSEPLMVPVDLQVFSCKCEGHFCRDVNKSRACSRATAFLLE